MNITQQIDEMSNFEKARWFSLIEAIDLISRECDERNVDFDEIKISPLDIEKYIEKTCDIFARKLDEDDEKLKDDHVLLSIDIPRTTTPAHTMEPSL
jgi:hypothetical protein